MFRRKDCVWLLAFAMLVVAFSGSAFAAKSGGKSAGGSTGGSAISLAPLVVDANGNGLPDFGDVVTFNISTTSTTQPYVNLQCTQDGAVVLNSWNGYFADALNTSWDFGLGSGAWQSGAGDCTATLGMYTKRGWSKLAATSFHVGA
ncbi:MAG TPA: hypothetical protein VFH74_02140 [Gaiellales bacterium]|nr:hypothetical protein [Gaiellales bacterium]